MDSSNHEFIAEYAIRWEGLVGGMSMEHDLEGQVLVLGSTLFSLFLDAMI